MTSLFAIWTMPSNESFKEASTIQQTNITTPSQHNLCSNNQCRTPNKSPSHSSLLEAESVEAVENTNSTDLIFNNIVNQFNESARKNDLFSTRIDNIIAEYNSARQGSYEDNTFMLKEELQPNSVYTATNNNNEANYGSNTNSCREFTLTSGDEINENTSHEHEYYLMSPKGPLTTRIYEEFNVRATDEQWIVGKDDIEHDGHTLNKYMSEYDEYESEMDDDESEYSNSTRDAFAPFQRYDYGEKYDAECLKHNHFNYNDLPTITFGSRRRPEMIETNDINPLWTYNDYDQAESIIRSETNRNKDLNYDHEEGTNIQVFLNPNQEHSTQKHVEQKQQQQHQQHQQQVNQQQEQLLHNEQLHDNQGQQVPEIQNQILLEEHQQRCHYLVNTKLIDNLEHTKQEQNDHFHEEHQRMYRDQDNIQQQQQHDEQQHEKQQLNVNQKNAPTISSDSVSSVSIISLSNDKIGSEHTHNTTEPTVWDNDIIYNQPGDCKQFDITMDHMKCNQILPKNLMLNETSFKDKVTKTKMPRHVQLEAELNLEVRHKPRSPGKRLTPYGYTVNRLGVENDITTSSRYKTEISLSSLPITLPSKQLLQPGLKFESLLLPSKYSNNDTKFIDIEQKNEYSHNRCVGVQSSSETDLKNKKEKGKNTICKKQSFVSNSLQARNNHSGEFNNFQTEGVNISLTSDNPKAEPEINGEELKYNINGKFLQTTRYRSLSERSMNRTFYEDMDNSSQPLALNSPELKKVEKTADKSEEKQNITKDKSKQSIESPLEDTKVNTLGLVVVEQNKKKTVNCSQIQDMNYGIGASLFNVYGLENWSKNNPKYLDNLGHLGSNERNENRKSESVYLESEMNQKTIENLPLEMLLKHRYLESNKHRTRVKVKRRKVKAKIRVEPAQNITTNHRLDADTEIFNFKSDYYREKRTLKPKASFGLLGIQPKRNENMNRKIGTKKCTAGHTTAPSHVGFYSNNKAMVKRISKGHNSNIISPNESNALCEQSIVNYGQSNKTQSHLEDEQLALIRIDSIVEEFNKLKQQHPIDSSEAELASPTLKGANVLQKEQLLMDQFVSQSKIHGASDKASDFKSSEELSGRSFFEESKHVGSSLKMLDQFVINLDCDSNRGWSDSYLLPIGQREEESHKQMSNSILEDIGDTSMQYNTYYGCKQHSKSGGSCLNREPTRKGLDYNIQSADPIDKNSHLLVGSSNSQTFENGSVILTPRIKKKVQFLTGRPKNQRGCLQQNNTRFSVRSVPKMRNISSSDTKYNNKPHASDYSRDDIFNDIQEFGQEKLKTHGKFSHGDLSLSPIIGAPNTNECMNGLRNPSSKISKHSCFPNQNTNLDYLQMYGDGLCPCTYRDHTETYQSLGQCDTSEGYLDCYNDTGEQGTGDYSFTARAELKSYEVEPRFGTAPAESCTMYNNVLEETCSEEDERYAQAYKKQTDYLIRDSYTSLKPSLSKLYNVLKYSYSNGKLSGCNWNSIGADPVADMN